MEIAFVLIEGGHIRHKMSMFPSRVRLDTTLLLSVVDEKNISHTLAAESIVVLVCVWFSRRASNKHQRGVFFVF